MRDDLGDLLHRIVSELAELARRYSTDETLTYTQLRMLGTLEDGPAMTQHRLGEVVGISDAAVSRALRPLAAAGLIEIVADPTHARKRVVSINDAGLAQYASAGRPMNTQLENWLRDHDFPYDQYLDMSKRLASLLADLPASDAD